MHTSVTVVSPLIIKAHRKVPILNQRIRHKPRTPPIRNKQPRAQANTVQQMRTLIQAQQQLNQETQLQAILTIRRHIQKVKHNVQSSSARPHQ